MSTPEQLRRAAQIKKTLRVPDSVESIAARLDSPPGKIVEYDVADGPPLFTHSPTLVERRTKLRDDILACLTEQPITLALLRRVEAAIAEHVI